MADVPYYDREPDSFPDEIITRATLYPGVWYASLDWGPHGYPGDPDYATGHGTKEGAIMECAAKIRRDIRRGRFGGYTLRFRMMKHWATKEANGR